MQEKVYRISIPGRTTPCSIHDDPKGPWANAGNYQIPEGDPDKLIRIGLFQGAGTVFKKEKNKPIRSDKEKTGKNYGKQGVTGKRKCYEHTYNSDLGKPEYTPVFFFNRLITQKSIIDNRGQSGIDPAK